MFLEIPDEFVRIARSAAWPLREFVPCAEHGAELGDKCFPSRGDPYCAERVERWRGFCARLAGELFEAAEVVSVD